MDKTEICKLSNISLSTTTTTPKRPSSLQLSLPIRHDVDGVSPSSSSAAWSPQSSVSTTEKPLSLAQKSLALQLAKNNNKTKNNCRVITSYCRGNESPIASLERIWENKHDEQGSDVRDNDSVKTMSPKRNSYAGGLSYLGRSETNLHKKAFWKKRIFCVPTRRRSVSDHPRRLLPPQQADNASAVFRW